MIREKNMKLITPLLIAIALSGCLGGFESKNGTGARPADVKFLKLPATATNISFWAGGAVAVAEFSVTEAEFRILYPNLMLKEIQDPVTMLTGDFANPSVAPLDLDVKITEGLTGSKEIGAGAISTCYDRLTGVGRHLVFSR